MKNNVFVDLKAIRNNALAVKNSLSEKVKLCAVVKADAYGHGGVVVANELYGICDCFAVALIEEGEQLRLCGIDKDILVLIPPEKTDIERAVEAGLILTAQNTHDLMRYEKEGKKQDALVRVHIKYNTGMNRFGADTIKELEQMMKKAAKLKHVRIEGLYSHFACPEKNSERKKAIDKFLLAIKTVKGYNNNVICHISASGGFLKKDADFDMVRIGLLLYGYKPFYGNRVAVKRSMSIEIPVIKNRSLNVGESAMYGVCRTDKKQDISLIRFGYADGLNRCCVDGQFNDRCMDVTAISGLHKGIYRITDMQKVAKAYHTIPYEIMTKIGIRANKNYIRRKK